MTRRRGWIGPLVALLLIVIVPVCWAGVLAGTLETETETAPSSSTTDEESEKYELEDEFQIVRTLMRLPRPPSAAATTPKQKPVAHRASTLLASVAPKSHPLRLSVRRQQ